MRKFGKESAAPESTGADRDRSGNGWLSGHRCALVLGVIVVVAFLLRFVFAYGVSADGNYALSGGSSAQYHLHVIESILSGSWSLTDAAVNYPIGGSLYIPPLMDFLAAGVASIVQGGMGTTEAASFGLAVLNPIFGALVCIPVYLIGREMFDKTIGVVAALVFAFLALPISISVFSSGTEYALAAFLIAFMAYFAVKMVKAVDAENSSKKGVIVYGAIAGLFLALSALTWNGFRVAVVLLVVAMVLQAVAARIGGKDIIGSTMGYAVAILVGTLVPAAYYVPAGLMDAVYSGPLLIAIVSVVFVFVFAALKAKPYVVTIPALVVAFIAVCAVLAFAAPQMFNDFIFGNTVYTNSIMAELASNRVSMSNVAAYYGWLTMWMPICLAMYETYVYFKKDRSSTQLFMTVWFYVMFFAVWTSYANAAVVGCVFAVGSAAVIVKVLKSANLRDWYASMKVAGFPGCFRKLIKPLPFVSVLVVALLVVVPNFSFAVDAGQPTNTEGDHFYTGNTSFTIKTGDSYPVGQIWAEYADAPKDGALISWIDYAYDAVSQGKFDSVTDSIGGGSSAAAQAYLADGSAGAIAAMMLRIMLSNPSVDYTSCFDDPAAYSVVREYIDNPDKAREEISNNAETYGKVRADITDENAVYLAGINQLLNGMNQVDLMDAYDKVCDVSGNKIGYILANGSMLPLQYNDGSSFSTIAYFADYQTDSYGAASEFFSYNTYYGTTQYTDAIYETFLWKSLIGPSASEAGYTSSSSYLVALSVSDGKDGSAKAIPGYGLAGFEVAQWLVMYNADDDATVSSDGWEYMDGWKAMEKQKTDRGVINYLYGIVMLKYTGSPENASTIDGEIKDSAGAGIDGATIAVYQYSDVYGKYVEYSSTKTYGGNYSAMVPSGDYRIDVKIGDIVVKSYTSSAPEASIIVEGSEVQGQVQVNGEVYKGEKMMLHIESDAMSKDIEVVDGNITISGVIPGTYSYTLYGEVGTSMGTGTVQVYPGSTDGFVVTPKTYTITATVNDIFGNTIDGTVNSPIVIATNEKTGAQFQTVIDKDGKAVITVVPGKYTVALGEGLVSINSNSQNATSGNRTVTITGYTSETVVIDGAPAGSSFTVSAGDFSTVSYERDGQIKFEAPKGLATDAVSLSVFGIVNGDAYSAVYTGGSSVKVSSTDICKVSGQLMNGDNGASGVVTLIGKDGFKVTVSTDSEGKYDVLVPKGDYTIYAHSGDDKVLLNSVVAKGDSASTSGMQLVDGRKVTANFKYDPATSESNKNLPFVLALITFTYEGTPYTITSMTNTAGAAIFYIPDNITAKTSFNNVAGTLDNNDAFDCKDLTKDVTSGTSSTSTTVTIQYVGYQENQDNIVKQQNVTAEFDMELTFYEKSDKTITMKKGETKALCPGQYDIKIDGASGGFFDGTAYLYPGQTVFSKMDVEEVVTVNVTKADNDRISITTEDGAYHAFTGGYYFEKGYVYYITSTGTNSNGKETIRYAYLDLTDSSEKSYSLDLTASAEKIKVTGYVGIAADGTLTVTGAGFQREFTVTSGAYTMELPADVGTLTVHVEVSKKVDNVTYWFAADGEFSGMKDGSIRNLAVVDSEKPESVDPDENAPDFEVEVDSATFSDGVASVTLTIRNNAEAGRTYFVTAGSAWTLDGAYSIHVDADSSASITVTGTYDAKRVAPGLDDVAVIVKDINGAHTVTEKITKNSAAQTGSEGMDIFTNKDEKDAPSDKVSASQYMYAVKFVNKDVYSKDVTFRFTVPTGWDATICDADGTYIGKVENGQATVTIYGLQTVTYYVALMQQSAEAGADKVSAPSIDLTVSDKTVKLEPVTVNVENTDSTVSGGDAIDSRSGLPAGIWFLIGVMILMLIATFWFASKRGVFARK